MHLFHLTYSKQSKYGWTKFKTAFHNQKLPIERKNLAFYRIKTVHAPSALESSMHYAYKKSLSKKFQIKVKKYYRTSSWPT